MKLKSLTSGPFESYKTVFILFIDRNVSYQTSLDTNPTFVGSSKVCVISFFFSERDLYSVKIT